MDTILGTLQSNNSVGRALRAGVGVTDKSGKTISVFGYVAPTTQMQVFETKVCAVDGDFGLNSRANDVWHFVKTTTREQPSLIQEGWVAEKHKGEVLCVFIPTPVPVEEKDVVVKVDTFAKRIVVQLAEGEEPYEVVQESL